mmetsp:Transcript_58403/g.107804  ORF Transcript_58403/g.107804 Transcript_58403/m.107804 type:complete len:235 (+) Transcript_58403:69-773(+)
MRGGRVTSACLRPRRRTVSPMFVALLFAAASAGLAFVGMHPLTSPGQRQSILKEGPVGGQVALSATMDPPTRQAPPDTGMDLSAGGQSAWVECRIEQCESEECRNFENWVFRKEHSQDYDAFLSVRNLEPAGILPGRFDSQKRALAASVDCRERSVDTELRCAQCIRLVIGGPYGARGVAVGAFPPQPEVLGCLEQSKLLPVTQPRAGERWDGNQEVPRQTAFCNTVNVGFPSS